jgi:hypothetical protein
MRQVSVTVDDQHKDSLDAVVEQLRAGGMTVDQVLGGLGIVTGSVPDDALGTLRGVEGVASVDEQLSHQLPPPDAEIQ